LLLSAHDQLEIALVIGAGMIGLLTLQAARAARRRFAMV
jgi:threonine dehydrogenase-like Zn-dependent dehydrogenase